jgi:hypothetical protein
VSWNGDGCHNCYFILRIPATLFPEEELRIWNAHIYGLAAMTFEMKEDFLEQLLDWREPESDDAWDLATGEAFDLGLDDFVTIEVTIDKEFEECLAELETSGEE